MGIYNKMKHKAGFTLIEIMLALSIISVGLIVIISAQSMTIKRIGASKNIAHILSVIDFALFEGQSSFYHEQAQAQAKKSSTQKTEKSAVEKKPIKTHKQVQVPHAAEIGFTIIYDQEEIGFKTGKTTFPIIKETITIEPEQEVFVSYISPYAILYNPKAPIKQQEQA
jgi:prepilin-type N-terminal cleavage/methylation domain-containing protein